LLFIHFKVNKNLLSKLSKVKLVNKEKFNENIWFIWKIKQNVLTLGWEIKPNKYKKYFEKYNEINELKLNWVFPSYLS
jgi:hypothetical protein